MRIPVESLRVLTEKALSLQGVAGRNASLQTDVLVEAELRGLPSHGLQRLPQIVARIQAGLADPDTTGSARWTRPSVLSVDGKRGLGPVVMMDTIAQLAVVARSRGIALAAIRNANHIGMLAYYVEAAARQNLIALVLTTSEALVHPFGGTEAMLGTNPIAIGIPTGAEPFVLDLATSRVSMGKIHHHALTGRPIPDDWAVDADGNRTTDPEAAKSGAIAPFGDAKGYGLGLAFELLVATLAGSDFATEVHGTLDATKVANKGDLIILIDPNAGDARAAGVASYLDRVRGSRAADPACPIAIPGDRMRARRARSFAAGIDLPDALHDQIQALSVG